MAVITDRVEITSGTEALVEGGTYSCGYYEGQGGAVKLSRAELYGNTVTFIGNTAVEGGAVYWYGKGELDHAFFCDNTAEIGGALIAAGGTLTIENAIFSGNTASFSGGAVALPSRTTSVLIKASTFTENAAALYGGAVEVSAGTLTLDDVYFSDNSAARPTVGYSGAVSNSAICVLAGKVTLATRSDVFYNRQKGTLIWDLSKASDTKDVAIENYKNLTNDGTLVLKVDNDLQITTTYTIATGIGSDLSGKNTFTLTGTSGQGDLSISVGQQQVYGAKRYQLTQKDDALVLTVEVYTRFVATIDNPVTLTAGTYSNWAPYSGNGAAGEVQSGVLTAVGSADQKIVFSSNTATNNGGAVYVAGGSATFANVVFDGNRAACGGAVYNAGMVVVSGLVSLNTASDVFYNSATGTVVWELSKASASNQIAIENYQYFSNNGGSLILRVDDNLQSSTSYTIATEIGTTLAGKDTFTITGVSGQNDVSITVGGMVSYNHLNYFLNQVADTLVLTVEKYQRFVATEDMPIALIPGKIYHNPDSYDQGGAGEVSSGTLSAVGTAEKMIVFRGNTATNNGGAVYVYDGNATFSQVMFSDNQAGYDGGAVLVDDGNATFTDVTFADNRTANGGALEVRFGNAVLSDVTFSGNTAYCGAAVYVDGSSTATFTGATFSNNYAVLFGGAVWVNGDYASFTDVVFTGNSVTKYYGGGLRVASGTVSLSDVTFTGNRAPYGGAIYNEDTVNLTGAVTLATASDTWLNGSSGKTNWDLRSSAPGNCACIHGFQYFGDGSYSWQTITVSATQTLGDYTIATGIGSSLAGKNTFSLTGISGQNDVNISVGQAVLYGDLNITLQQESDSLVLTVSQLADGVFYCKEWTTGERVSVTWHGTPYTGTVGDGAFCNTYAAAKDASAARDKDIVILKDSTITSATHYDAQNIYISGENAYYKRMVLGGELISGNHSYSGSYTVNIEAGTFAREVAGGDASNGYVDRTGTINLNISGGVFLGHVLGGSYYSVQSVFGSTSIRGDINFTISGGSFAKRVYGGSGSQTEQISSRVAMQGNVNLTIDASVNSISFGESVAAGNRGYGMLVGSTNVKVTGSGSNLHFADDSVLFGGCGGDYYENDSGVRQACTSVVDPATWEDAGVRALTFDHFSGAFDAEIRMFSDISFQNNTNLNFADVALDLKEIEKWNFDCTSTASNLTKNKFSGDTIAIDTTALSSSWTLLSGSAEAFSDLASATSVSFNGNAASWSGGAWSDGSFSLSVDGNKLIVSKLA